MKSLRNRLLACAVAAAAMASLIGGARVAEAAKDKPAAKGVVAKLDTSAKTFTVTTKKKGDAVVTYDDKTAFKKAPADPTGTATDGTAADLKDGLGVQVKGKYDAGKIAATEVTIGGAKKKKKNKPTL